MIVNNPSPDGSGLHAEASHTLGQDLLDAAEYPEDVLAAAVTLLRADIARDLAEAEDYYAATGYGYLTLTWVEPLDDAPVYEASDEEEDADE